MRLWLIPVAILLQVTWAVPRAHQLRTRDRMSSEALVVQTQDETRAAIQQEQEDAEKEHLGPLMAVVVIPMLMSLANGALASAIHATFGQCVSQTMPDADSIARLNVQQSLLQWCPSQQLVWDPDSGASQPRTWSVHSTFGGGFLWMRECRFEFGWRPKAGGQLHDCRADSIARQHGAAKAQQLLGQYPPNHFQRHVTGINFEFDYCRSRQQNSYVRSYVALPSSAFDTAPADAQTAYANAPFFYVNIEGWTVGDCSGYKAPGVQWTFSYKVDVSAGRIYKWWTPNPSNNRPVFSNNAMEYVPSLSVATGRTAPEQVFGYVEKTKALCGRLNTCQE